MSDKEHKLFFELKEVAKIAGFSYCLLYTWVRKGLIPSIQPSGPKGKFFIKMKDLEEFLNIKL